MHIIAALQRGPHVSATRTSKQVIDTLRTYVHTESLKIVKRVNIKDTLIRYTIPNKKLNLKYCYKLWAVKSIKTERSLEAI